MHPVSPVTSFYNQVYHHQERSFITFMLIMFTNNTTSHFLSLKSFHSSRYWNIRWPDKEELIYLPWHFTRNLTGLPLTQQILITLTLADDTTCTVMYTLKRLFLSHTYANTHTLSRLLSFRIGVSSIAVHYFWHKQHTIQT